MSLHIFHNEAAEWVIAETAEDAATIQQAETGMGTGDPDWDADCYAFVQWPDDKPLTIWEDETPPTKETLSPAEWIAKHGRGFFFAGEP